MKRTIFLYGLTTVLLTSCSEASEKPAVEKPAPVKSEQPIDLKKITTAFYSMSIPVDMTENKELNSDASLAYMNAGKNEFVIVIDEPKADIIRSLKEAGVYAEKAGFMENYSKVSIERLTSNISLNKPGIKGSLKAVSGQLLTYQAEGKMSDVPEDLNYFLGFAESKTHAYTIMAWTLKRNAKSYEQTVDEMMKSFKTK